MPKLGKPPEIESGCKKHPGTVSQSDGDVDAEIFWAALGWVKTSEIRNRRGFIGLVDEALRVACQATCGKPGV